MSADYATYQWARPSVQHWIKLTRPSVHIGRHQWDPGPRRRNDLISNGPLLGNDSVGFNLDEKIRM
ncbi:hypothetical protein ABH944_006320 [Caballeronia udeis]|uniref:Uncharacterized protein n=1 Tax=Caballeronia udeis TaxID=1232866 RepID=A0ABW8MRF2_9BURK